MTNIEKWANMPETLSFDKLPDTTFKHIDNLISRISNPYVQQFIIFGLTRAGDIEKLNNAIRLAEFGIEYFKLEELTIRRYYAFASFIQNVTAWELIKQAEYSGFVEIKNPIKHYLTEDDGTFSNLVKADEVKEKLK